MISQTTLMFVAAAAFVGLVVCIVVLLDDRTRR